MGYTQEGVGYQSTDTSLVAAQEINMSAKTIRAKVLMALRQAGEPLTSEDLATHLGLPYRSVQPRLAELRNAGRVEDSGLRALSSFNRNIILWRIADDV